MAASSASYMQTLSSMADSLKPGGSIHKTMMDDIDLQGQQLGAQLSGSAIGKGFGNAQVGGPVQVAKHVAQLKQKANSDLLERYMSTIGSLAQMQQQNELTQAKTQADQYAQTRSLNQQGQQFGQEMEFKTAQQQQQGQQFGQTLGIEQQKVNAELARMGIGSSLSAAAGAGAGGAGAKPLLTFGSSSSASSVAPAGVSAPKSYNIDTLLGQIDAQRGSNDNVTPLTPGLTNPTEDYNSVISQLEELYGY